MRKEFARVLERRITEDTRRKIEKIVRKRATAAARILDLGCGGDGSFDYGALRVTGADRILERITKRADKAVIVNVDKKLPFKNQEFGLVTFSGVIQYLNNPEGAIKEINRILKPKGILILATVNRSSLLRTIGIIRKEPKVDAGEKRIYLQQELKRLLHKCNFKVVDVFGADFMWMPKNLSSNLVVVARKG